MRESYTPAPPVALPQLPQWPTPGERAVRGQSNLLGNLH
ncbi:MAG: hypothetical protein KatS3mg077_0407 [Candidatus Binatia bacterium]|nr:MAG: hypothetical protein KatS3mg077_0407 [Candidatus Binatia bacterium]